MDTYEIPGDPPLKILLRRSARARRISLRVSDLDGRVTLTLPRRARDSEAFDFANAKASWIRKHLSRRATAQDVELGGGLMYQGREIRIEPGSGRAATMSGDTLRVPGTPDMVPARVKAFLKLRAKADLSACATFYAAKLGRSVAKITLRDTRSRWGSCTTAGNLMFSWRLIMAPPDVLDYVAAHEVAHLIEMNHSDAYWRIVQEICPDYQQHRHWLRQNGGTLHRYRFGD